MYAFCYRSGQIKFGKSIPAGALIIAKGPERPLREMIEGKARLAYDNETLLVPGIPEAESEQEARVALAVFVSRINRSLSKPRP